MLESGCIYIYLLLSLFPFPGEDFGEGFRGRTVSSMVWGIEHCLLLRSPFTADRFYHIYGHYLALWWWVCNKCVSKPNFVFSGHLRFSMFSWQLCVCEGTTWLFLWLCNLISEYLDSSLNMHNALQTQLWRVYSLCLDIMQWVMMKSWKWERTLSNRLWELILVHHSVSSQLLAQSTQIKTLFFAKLYWRDPCLSITERCFLKNQINSVLLPLILFPYLGSCCSLSW